jgi:hypothetical protein
MIFLPRQVVPTGSIKMTQKHHNSKYKGIIFLVVILFLALVFSFWEIYKYKIANQKINSLVDKKSKGIYSISYKNLLFDEIAGSLSADSIIVSADTAVYNKMPQQDKPSVLVDLVFPKIRILHVSTPKALLTKEISGEELVIDSAFIRLSLHEYLKNTVSKGPGEEIYKQILGQFKSIAIGRIVLNHTRLEIDEAGTADKFIEIKDISIVLNEMQIDSLHNNDTSRVLFSKNVSVACKTLEILSKDKKYKINIQGMEYLSANSSFKIDSLQVLPRLSENAFAKAAHFQKDRYNFTFQNMLLTGINRQELWKKKIVARQLQIGASNFSIYRDTAYPVDSTQSEKGSFPQQQFMHLSVPIFIEKVNFTHSFIEYKEKEAASNQSGKVQFYDMEASFTNATNINSFIAQNNICRVHFYAKLLNKANLNAFISLYLKDPTGQFNIDGSLSPINGSALNALTLPMAMVNIKKGTVDSLDFKFNGNNLMTNGELLFLYHDVSLQLLKKKADNNFKNKFLPTLLLNNLAKKSNRYGSDTKYVQVEFKKTGRTSIFNMIWKPVLQGVKKTMGLK